jgi:hypothetical protein
MDIVSTTNQNTSTDKIEAVYHTGASTWGSTEYSGLNYTQCDTGTGNAICTNTGKYRRIFIFDVGYNDTTDYTQLHQLLPSQTIYYNTIAECLDTINNPITYTLPSYYQYSARMLYAYCSRPSPTSLTWQNTNWINLRGTVSSVTSSGVDTAIFLTKDGMTSLTGNWDVGNYSINNISSASINGNLSIGAGTIQYNNSDNKYYYYNTTVWKELGSSSGSGVPAGMIAPFNLTSCPTGWIAADGSSGTPDLRGIFIRGSGTNSILKYANGSYFSSVLGSYKNDSFQGFFIEAIHRRYSASGTVTDVGTEIRTYESGASGVGGNGLTSEQHNLTIKENLNYGTPRYGNETTPAYYSTIYCVKTTEDSATSNSIWTTSGNNVQLNNASKKLNLSQDVVSNFTLASNTPNLKFQIPFTEGPSTAGKIIFTNQDYYSSGMAGIRSELYSQENDNGALIFSAMSVGTLYDVMTINGQGTTIHQSLTVTGQGSTINQSDWIAPTFQNSWVNYGDIYGVAGYMKDSMGFVHLQGLVKSGTVQQCIFTLPAGYRPQYTEIHAVISNNTIGRVDISTVGCVFVNTGSNIYTSLDGITFKAYQ